MTVLPHKALELSKTSRCHSSLPDKQCDNTQQDYGVGRGSDFRASTTTGQPLCQPYVLPLCSLGK